jgi:hypothetical protein
MTPVNKRRNTMVNKIVEITMKTGWLNGFKSKVKMLDEQVAKFNAEGWEVHQFIPGNARASWAENFKRMLKLIITFGASSKYAIGTMVLKKNS